MRRFGFIALVLGVFAVSAIRAAEFTVRVGEYYFHPAILNIAPGDTVTWLDEGFQPHDSTSINGTWASPTLFPGETFSFTFTSAGDFRYVCARHIANFPQQTGVVVVAAMNLPPSVRITSPGSGATFLAPASFTVAADAIDSDGSVTNVQFLVNGNPVGSSTGPTFGTTVSALPAGSYSLTAIATDNQGATAPSDPVSVTVTNPAARYPLVISVSPSASGTVEIDPAQPPDGYEAGAQVTLTANAASGFAFSDWGGDATGTQNPLVMTMDGPKAITANFILNTVPTHTLALTVNPAGGGTIVAQPAPNGPNGTYLAGTVVTLTASAALNFAFTNWSGDVASASNPVTVTLDSDKAVTANFVESITPLVRLTVLTNPPGAGTIQVSPPPNGTNGTYIQGTVVTLTATGLGTNAFTNWTGAVSSTTNRISLLMDADQSITANFLPVVPPSFTLTVLATPTTGGVVLVTPASSNGTYSAGTTVALAARANPGFQFTGWSGSVNSTNNPIVIVMNGDRSVTADFTPMAAIDFKEIAGAFSGLLTDAAVTNFPALSYAASGAINVRVSRTGAYRGAATIGGMREFVSGQFDRFGYAPLIARRATLSGSLQIDDTGLRIFGVLTDGTRTSSLLLYRNVARTNIAGLAGDYALVADGMSPVEGPGSILLSVLDSGAVRMRGTLGDGTGFNERTFVSPDATIPVFAPLYGRRGVLMGWLDFNDAGTVQGSVRWFRPGNSRSLNYPAGFGVVVPVTGSRSN